MLQAIDCGNSDAVIWCKFSIMSNVACTVLNESGSDVPKSVIAAISHSISRRFRKKMPEKNAKVNFKLEVSEMQLRIAGHITFRRGPGQVFFHLKKIEGLIQPEEQ